MIAYLLPPPRPLQEVVHPLLSPPRRRLLPPPPRSTSLILDQPPPRLILTSPRLLLPPSSHLRTPSVVLAPPPLQIKAAAEIEELDEGDSASAPATSVGPRRGHAAGHAVSAWSSGSQRAGRECGGAGVVIGDTKHR